MKVGKRTCVTHSFLALSMCEVDADKYIDIIMILWGVVMDKEIIDEIIDMLIEEAKENPDWKAENALRCAKKMLLRNKKGGDAE